MWMRIICERISHPIRRLAKEGRNQERQRLNNMCLEFINSLWVYNVCPETIGEAKDGETRKSTTHKPRASP